MADAEANAASASQLDGRRSIQLDGWPGRQSCEKGSIRASSSAGMGESQLESMERRPECRSTSDGSPASGVPSTSIRKCRRYEDDEHRGRQ